MRLTIEDLAAGPACGRRSWPPCLAEDGEPQP